MVCTPPLVNLKSHQDDEEYDQIPRAYAIAFTSDKTDGQTKGYITTGGLNSNTPIPADMWSFTP